MDNDKNEWLYIQESIQYESKCPNCGKYMFINKKEVIESYTALSKKDKKIAFLTCPKCFSASKLSKELIENIERVK